MAEVRLESVTKKFNSHTIIPELNMLIKHGEFVSLLGPSGCGKTTCLRMIAGLEKNDSGEIFIDQEMVSSPKKSIFIPSNKRGLGMVFQSYALWPHLSVFENIAFPLRMQKVTKQEIQTRVNEILTIVELNGYAERSPQQLSGGQQQRVALARGLVAHPKVLLMDEPLSNLDTLLREKMRKDIRRLQQLMGITVIYVTHDQKEAFEMSDRVMVMDHGVLIQSGTPQEICQNPQSAFVKSFISTH